MAIILDGAACAKEIRREIRMEAANLPRMPGLAVIRVGDDPASQVYVRNKSMDCADCGFLCEDHALPATTAASEIVKLIGKLNCADGIDGILVQLPLPKGLDPVPILEAIAPVKDVDGFTTASVGRLVVGVPWYSPCTPAGILELLRRYDIPIKGKHCVIVGRSNIVGKPLAQLMLQEDATVTVCHSKTPRDLLAGLVSRADIFVSAVGDQNYLWEQRGLLGPWVLIDVAMNRNTDGKLCGDIPESWYKECTAYTPVPGGVGPMARAMLMRNVLTAAKRRLGRAT